MNYFSGYIQSVQPVLHRSPFPLDSLPTLLYETVLDVYEQTQAPIPLIVASVFSAISLTCQPLINVCCREGGNSPVSLFSIVIAESGERKTSVDRLVMQPFYKQDAMSIDENQCQLEGYKTKLLVWETMKKAILRNMSKKAERYESTEEEESRLIKHEKQQPALPKFSKIIYGNTTAEALQHGMYTHGSYVGLIADEGGNILGRRAINDLSFLNSMWDGVSFSVDRRTTESFVIPDGRLTLSVMVQGAIFDSYLQRQEKQARGSGFFARCLPVRIDEATSTQGRRFLWNRAVPSAHLEQFHQHIEKLLSEVQKARDDGKQPITIKFSHSAQFKWQEIYNSIESQIAPGGYYHEMRDFASKLANNIARMATLFHYFTEGEGEVDQHNVERANQICHWYGQQAISLFAIDSEIIQNTKRAACLITWLVKKFNQRGVAFMKKNDIRQLGPRAIRDKHILNDVLGFLHSTGHVILWQHPNGTCLVYKGANFLRPIYI